MRASPRLPDDTVNRSGVHPLAEAAKLLAGLFLISGLLFGTFFWGINVVIVHLPVRWELKFEKSISDGFLPSDSTLAVTQATVQNLTDQIAEGWSDNPYTFRLFIMPDRSPNAFAIPGGIIGITSGLLDMMQSENELAFVIGHEIGHFKQRDHLRGLSRTLAFALTGLALGISGVNTDLTDELQTLAQRKFSRIQESGADLVGLELLAAHYGHAASATAFFKKMNLKHQNQTSLDNFYSSHPIDNQRIKNIEKAAAQMGISVTGEITAWSRPE